MIANPVWVALLAAFSNAYALPKVVVFATGGTISGKHDPAKGGYLPALSGSDLVAAVPKLKEIAEIQVEQIDAIYSADMTPEIWLRLSRDVQGVLKRSRRIWCSRDSWNEHPGRDCLLSGPRYRKR